MQNVSVHESCFFNIWCCYKMQSISSNMHSTMSSTITIENPILPGLPEDVAMHCLALVPRANFPAMSRVSTKWRSLLRNKELVAVRRLAGKLEEWLYVMSWSGDDDDDAGGWLWEVFDCYGSKRGVLPVMPGPVKTKFGVAAVDGKILVMAGYTTVDGCGSPSDEVYCYDSCLNSWRRLADMNVPRYDFACAEVNGRIYAVGGYGSDTEPIWYAEMYDPDTDKWTMIRNLPRPIFGCFACGLEGQLYVMGGISNFTIGNSRLVDVYDPQTGTWYEMENGCDMVTSHAVLGNKLFCIERKNENQTELSVFRSDNSTWNAITVPQIVTVKAGFQLGVLDNKVLLFPLEGDSRSRTLIYDPEAPWWLEWHTTDLKPSGLSLCSVTIKV